MESSVARRSFAQSASANAVVTGLSSSHKRWVARSEYGPDIVAVPPLDGELVFDPSLRSRASADLGRIVSHLPWAVLVPGSVTDVEQMVRFANRHHLRIAARSTLEGTHSTFGQSQVESGVVIDMSQLARVADLAPEANQIWVEAGATWNQVLAQTLKLGKSPRVIPDYASQSIGGTLSVGGIGGQSHRAGLAADHVLELDVVTGNGDLVRCSRTAHPFLFSSVLGGLGQFGIIVRACLALRDAGSWLRLYSLSYDHLSTFVSDQNRLVSQGRVDLVQGFAEPGPEGWRFRIEAARWPGGAESETGDSARELELAGLAVEPNAIKVTDTLFTSFVKRRQLVVADVRTSLGEHGSRPGSEALEVNGGVVCPWVELLVPADQVESIAGSILEQTPASELGRGEIVFYPLTRAGSSSRYPVLPAAELSYLVAVRRVVPAANAKRVANLLLRNRAFFELARASGGTFYPTGALPLEPADWRTHFGRPLGWVLFGMAKRMFDHRFLLTPGQKIFRPS